jgi:hypothetical protein
LLLRPKKKVLKVFSSKAKCKEAAGWIRCLWNRNVQEVIDFLKEKELWNQQQ